MTPTDQRLLTDQVQHASYSIDALCDLLRAANGEPISAVSMLTLLEPMRDGLHSACDQLERARRGKRPS